MNNANQNEFSLELYDGILDHIPIPDTKIIPNHAPIDKHDISIFNDNVKIMIQCYIDAQARLSELSTLVLEAETKCLNLSREFNVTKDINIMNEIIQYNFAKRKFEKDHIIQLDITIKLHKYLCKKGVKIDSFFSFLN